jgi:hypothetical protein
MMNRGTVKLLLPTHQPAKVDVLVAHNLWTHASSVRMLRVRKAGGKHLARGVNSLTSRATGAI